MEEPISTTTRGPSGVRLGLLVVLIVAVLAVPTLIFGERFEVMLDGERALEFVRGHGPWGAVVAVALIVADLVIPVPAPAIMTALGLVYGALIGGAIASFGSFFAATFAYVLCRMIGPRAASWIAGPEQIARVHDFFTRHGAWAIGLSRWMPAVPEVLACLAGLTRMPFLRFTLGNGIGSLAVGFAYAYFGARGEDNPGAVLALAAVMPLAALPLFFIIVARERKLRAPSR